LLQGILKRFTIGQNRASPFKLLYRRTNSPRPRLLQANSPRCRRIVQATELVTVCTALFQTAQHSDRGVWLTTLETLHSLVNAPLNNLLSQATQPFLDTVEFFGFIDITPCSLRIALAKVFFRSVSQRFGHTDRKFTRLAIRTHLRPSDVGDGIVQPPYLEGMFGLAKRKSPFAPHGRTPSAQCFLVQKCRAAIIDYGTAIRQQRPRQDCKRLVPT
jgi:hypothetical protein